MIFLSYAREDSERANRIYSMVNKPDRPVFYDKESLVPGMDWREEIEKTLETCKLVLILCSRHTEEKEGFFQKEIRFALERSEMMPEGRIFIMPIRFDNANVPRKIAKYQWLDIKNDADMFSIENYVDLAWRQIMKLEPVDISILRREDIVMLMRGKNPEGRRTFTYMKLSIFGLRAMKSAIVECKVFQPSDFGKVLVSGEGDPSIEIREFMAREYQVGEVPSASEVKNYRREVALEKYHEGYKEAFLTITGSEMEPPSIQPPDDILEKVSPLQEGIKKGMQEALRSLPSENA